MRRRFPVRAALLAAGAAGLLSAAGCRLPFDSFDPVTGQGLAISNLFVFSFILSAFVLALVIGLLGYMLVRFRARPGDAEPAQVHGNRNLEIAWTVGPILLLTVLFVLSCQTVYTVEQPAANPLAIQVIGHQWWWEYRYPELGVTTANELHVPVGQPVRLDIQAADVLHSFWVPQIGWKLDAINGKTNVIQMRADRPGIYEGACTEYCGTEHAWMRIRLIAETAEQFTAWTARQAAPAPAAANASRGMQLFTQNTCISCHALQGTGGTATVGPDLSHFGSRTILGAGVLDNTPQNLHDWLQNPQRIKPGALMPAYDSLSEADLRALVDYLEGLQ